MESVYDDLHCIRVVRVARLWLQHRFTDLHTTFRKPPASEEAGDGLPAVAFPDSFDVKECRSD
ncbi:hypothetical protein, partial [Sedimentibacter sp. B4]|uniref:hypothetical protein n=1 Tax=Sedimentibacter sp. B4 TaxID=304766 RepID=UPI001E595328